MRRCAPYWILIIWGLSGCGSVSALPTTGGSLTLATDQSTVGLGSNLLTAYEAENPNLDTTLTPLPRPQALRAVDNGTVDATLLLYPPTTDGPFFTTIGQEMIVMIVNESEPIVNLTERDVRSLYTGQVSGWQASVGPPQPIGTFEETSLSVAFSEIALGGEAQSDSVQLAEDGQQALAMIVADNAQIAYVPYSQIRTGSATLPLNDIVPEVGATAYPYMAPVVFVAQDEPTGRLRDFLDWIISADGQAVVRRQMAGITD